jgi:2-C-methyl-D-erythritol 2,4-cyclodiphosphate synthase|tara:strand:- start:5659 stop:6141 length:483 start_codon:yes stop_codon:yes gene_type:complete
VTTRFGLGVDVHPLVDGRNLVLGGVAIPHDKGLAGHSDGDVLTHAVIDAVLGAAGLGDIGLHFPSDDQQYEGAVSVGLLTQTVAIIAEANWRVEYVDATIIAERPILRPHIADIESSLADALRTTTDSVNVKATTTDGLGFTGRGEGIAGMAVATLSNIR